jgi:hypothetical protein
MSKVIIDFPHFYTEKEMDAFAEMFENESYPPHPDRPLPFECAIWDTEPVEVKNRFGYGSCILPPDAVAVYDCIQGAEMCGNWEMMNQGLDWFRKHFPDEYMILLD